MTKVVPELAKCGVCGKGNEVYYLSSTHHCGACDLDTRPLDTERFTIFLQRCVHCGYINTEISDGDDDLQDFVGSQMYKTCEELNPVSEEAKQYIQYALLQAYKQVATIWNGKEESYAQDNIFWGYMNAAWACDDRAERKKDDQSRLDAIKCRNKCLAIINSLIVNKKDQKEKEKLIGIKADLLRRTGQFDALVVEYENKVFESPYMNALIHFQIDRAKERDDKRYSTDNLELKK